MMRGGTYLHELSSHVLCDLLKCGRSDTVLPLTTSFVRCVLTSYSLFLEALQI